MMDTTNLVIGSSVVIVSTSVLKNARNKTPAGTTFRPVIFGFGLAFALLAISMVSQGLARALAYMGLVGAFAANGQAVFDTIGVLGKTK
jgi:hypothetical protein